VIYIKDTAEAILVFIKCVVITVCMSRS